MMRGVLRIVLSIALWVALVVYLVFAARLCGEYKSQIYVQRVDIRVTDADRINVVTPEMVSGWLTDKGYDFLNQEVVNVNTEEVQQVIAGQTFVKNAKIYTDLRGVVHIDVTQRRPVVRVSTADGYNFYISDDNWILPVPLGSAMYVPVVSGHFRLPFERGYYGNLEAAIGAEEKKSAKDYAFMLNLINFVRLTAEDNFWNAQIVQIVVNQKGLSGTGDVWKEPEVEIVPRVGNFVVGLGTLVDVNRKLDTLLHFYRTVLSYEGWDSYRYIDLKYRGQVVCRK